MYFNFSIAITRKLGLGNRLGRGEAEAIAIAIEMDADVFCLDDYPARSEAIRLGLEVKGTLGIIRKLMELDKFECNLENLSENLKRIKSLARFMEFHFEARYPDEQQNFYKKCTKKFAAQKLQDIREAFIWLKERL